MTSVFILHQLRHFFQTRHFWYFICPLTIPQPNTDPFSWNDLITFPKEVVIWSFLNFPHSVSNFPHSPLWFLLSPFCDLCVHVCVCGQFSSATSVPRVARRQHTITKVLPFTPATHKQTHSGRKAMRAGRVFKISAHILTFCQTFSLSLSSAHIHSPLLSVFCSYLQPHARTRAIWTWK